VLPAWLDTTLSAPGDPFGAATRRKLTVMKRDPGSGRLFPRVSVQAARGSAPPPGPHPVRSQSPDSDRARPQQAVWQSAQRWCGQTRSTVTAAACFFRRDCSGRHGSPFRLPADAGPGPGATARHDSETRTCTRHPDSAKRAGQHLETRKMFIRLENTRYMPPI
jgi:hypothetical protein